MNEKSLETNLTSVSQRRQFERMSSDKFICELLGIELLEVGDRFATASLTLSPMHLNGVGVCQGGVLFSIADYVLAAAFNYTEECVVSQDVSISYCRAAKAGSRITATAKETVRTRSTALGDVVVTDENGRTIAYLRGRGFVLKSQ